MEHIKLNLLILHNY